MPGLAPSSWLPEGKACAICFTVDDVHPGTSSDAYEAGGDLDRGALGHLAWLLARHPRLRITLFVTADWREVSAIPTRRLAARVPWVRDRVFLSRVLPRGTMRLDRHPGFVRYLRGIERFEIALHGLHHVHRGDRIFVEFQDDDESACGRALDEMLSIFDAAGLPHVRGMQPPGWNAPPGLLRAMARRDFAFLASARDIQTPIEDGATASMSGLRGVSLTRPELIEGGALLHLTTNFQATSPIERARAILRSGGLLAIKAHIVKNALGFVMLDGVDGAYMNYLDLLLRELDREFGDALWWTSMGEVAAHVRAGGARERAREAAC